MIDIKQVNGKNFTNYRFNVKGVAIVECYNTSKASVKIMEPILERVKERFYNSFEHFRIDVAQNPFVINDFFALHVPTFLIFCNGDLIDRIDGMVPYDDFVEKLGNHIEQKDVSDNF